MDTGLMLIVIFCVWTTEVISQENKTSDACHGNINLLQSKNVLTCGRKFTICISEVIYYQWPGGPCPWDIPAPVDPQCCVRDVSRCSITLDKEGLKNLQRECIDTLADNTCRLPAGDRQDMDRQCFRIGGATVSSVRTIIYTCVEGSCTVPVDSTSTPSSSKNYGTHTLQQSPTATSMSPNMFRPVSDGFNNTGREFTEDSTAIPPTLQSGNATGLTNKTENHDELNIGAIVGGIFGAIVVIVIVIAIVIVYKKRVGAGSKARSTATPDVLLGAVEKDLSKASANTNSGFQETTAQPRANTTRNPPNSQDDDDISKLYAQVNKKGKTFSAAEEQLSSSNYDHVHGKSAQFQVTQPGDYDHVVSFGGNGEACVNYPDIRMSSYSDTYDKLHRPGPSTGVTVDDTYNRLHQATTGHAEGSDAQLTNNVYDFAKAFANDTSTLR